MGHTEQAQILPIDITKKQQMCIDLACLGKKEKKNKVGSGLNNSPPKVNKLPLEGGYFHF